MTDTSTNSKNIQLRAAALWKYGKLYPKIFPFALSCASELYALDRKIRGIEDG